MDTPSLSPMLTSVTSVFSVRRFSGEFGRVDCKDRRVVCAEGVADGVIGGVNSVPRASSMSTPLLLGRSVIDGSSLRCNADGDPPAAVMALASSNSSAVKGTKSFLQACLSTRTALPGICTSDRAGEGVDSTAALIIKAEDTAVSVSVSRTSLAELPDCNRTGGETSLAPMLIDKSGDIIGDGLSISTTLFPSLVVREPPLVPAVVLTLASATNPSDAEVLSSTPALRSTSLLLSVDIPWAEPPSVSGSTSRRGDRASSIARSVVRADTLDFLGTWVRSFGVLLDCGRVFGIASPGEARRAEVRDVGVEAEEALEEALEELSAPLAVTGPAAATFSGGEPLCGLESTVTPS